MINMTAGLMAGKGFDFSIVPQHAESIYYKQDTVGWDNYIKGRIV